MLNRIKKKVKKVPVLKFFYFIISKIWKEIKILSHAISIGLASRAKYLFSDKNSEYNQWILTIESETMNIPNLKSMIDYSKNISLSSL